MKFPSLLIVFYIFLLHSFLAKGVVVGMPIDVRPAVVSDSSDVVIPLDTTTGNTKSLISNKTKNVAISAINSLFGEATKFNNADSLLYAFDKLPSFGIYKDNYIVAGGNVTGKPSGTTSDAKFQISVRQRLTNSKLPFKTYLFLTYTQKALWDIFRNSFPFRDINYNPTIGIGKALIVNHRFLGTVVFQLEHESNGKDGSDSRSWNKISLTSNLIFDQNWSIQAKAWIPIIDGQGNRDITRYAGWATIGGEYKSSDTKYIFSVVVNKRSVPNFSSNIILNLAVRLFNDENQYLFAEFYNGYGECLLDYKEYRQRLRLGFVIKSDLSSIF